MSVDGGGPTAADMGLDSASLADPSSETKDVDTPTEPAVKRGGTKLSEKLRALEAADKPAEPSSTDTKSGDTTADLADKAVAPDGDADIREGSLPHWTEDALEGAKDSSLPLTEVDVASRLSQRLILRKATELRRKNPDDLTENEELLLTVDSFVEKGFEGVYKKYEDQGGIPVGGNLTVNGLRVIAITGERPTTDGDKYYTCTVEDPADPSRKTAEISGLDLAAEHMAMNITEIADNFQDPNERKLIEWLVKDDDKTSPLSPDEITALNTKIEEAEARENSPVGKRDRIIQENITRLHTEINDAVEAGEDVPEAKRRFVAQLELAQALKGSQIENWANRAVLKSLDPAKAGDLTDLLAELAPGADAELDALEPQLKAAGVSTAEFKLLQEKGLGAILGNDILTAKFSKMENIDNVLGENMDQDKLISILDKNISPKDKALWDKMKGGGKLSGGLLLAILIGIVAIPAAAVVAGAQIAGKRAA